MHQVQKRLKDIDQRRKDIEDSINMPIVGKLQPEKIKSLTDSAALLKNRIDRLEKVMAIISSLENSGVKYAVQITSGDEGGTIYDKDSKKIVFKVHGPGNFIHEITHGSQFEKGQLAFKKDTGGPFGDDAGDEIEAYSMQFAFDPDSVIGLHSSSTPSTFPTLTEAWLKDLAKDDGSKPYADGGSAQLALRAITIYSSRQRILNAYRYIQDRSTRWPPGYKTISDTNLYFKK